MAAGKTYNPVSLVNREKMCAFILLDARLKQLPYISHPLLTLKRAVAKVKALP